MQSNYSYFLACSWLDHTGRVAVLFFIASYTADKASYFIQSLEIIAI